MASISLPRQFKSQPQTGIDLAPQYKDNAEIFMLGNDLAGRELARNNNFSSGFRPSLISRSHGRTLYFDGATTLLTSDRNVPVGAAFTVFTWVRPAALNTGYSRILETQYDSAFYLGSNSGSQYAWIVNGASLEGCIGGQQVIGQRDFLCGVYDGSNRLLYVNGRLVASSAATTPLGIFLLRVGYSNAGGVFAWNGDIDTVGVFTRAFPAAEVRSIYEQPNRLLKAPAPRVTFVDSPLVATTIPVLINHLRSQGIM